MSIWVNIGTISIGLLLIALVIRLMVNKKMTESQSILWLIIGLAAIIVGFFPKIITVIADVLGIWYPPSIILLILFIGLLFIVFKNTIMISVQNNQISELFMQVSLLNLEVEKLREELKSIKEEGTSD